MVMAMSFGPVHSRPRRAAVTALIAFGLCAGCGSAGRTAAHVGDDVAHVPRPHVEVPVPHVGEGGADEAAVAARQSEILTPVDDMTAADRQTAIDFACRARTGYDLSQIEDDDELVYEAALEFGGDTTKGVRAVELVRDLYESDSPADVIGQAAATGICGV
jgi:hypothetical protein